MTTTPFPRSAGTVARLEDVTHRYGPTVALNGVDLELHAGEVTALLGPNGAGKTTTVHLLLGLLAPAAGRVSVFGRAPRTLAARQRMGAMLQISKVPETLRVREHLELVASYYPAPLPVEETLRLAGLEGLERRLFGRLSGGQKQRLLFALAVCGNPDLLFLDEPTTGLDVEARRELWDCVRRLVADGRTVLLTTHHLEEADALAGRVVVLNEGRIVADGTPVEIKGRAAGRWIRCRTWAAEPAVASWPEVSEVRRHGPSLEIWAREAEPVVRRLLDLDADLADLEVRSAGLEEALLALTAEPPASQEIAA